MAEKNDVLKTWRERIEAGIRYRKNSGEDRWRAYIRFFRGFSRGQLKLTDMSDLNVNLIKRDIALIRAATYFQNPRVIVEPEEENQPVLVGDRVMFGDEQAKLIQAIDNRLLPKLGAKWEIRRAIVDAHLTALGIVKVSHETSTVSTNEGIEKVTAEKYSVRRISPFRMVFDPSADAFDLNRCAWVAEMKYLSESDVDRAVEQGLYSKKEAKEIKYDQTAFVDSTGIDEINKMGSEVFNKAVIWEVHDLSNGRLVEYASGAEKPLRDERHPYDVDGYIYEILGFDEVPDEFYPTPYVESLAGVNHWINRLMRYFIEHAGRYSAKKAIYNNDYFDPDEIVKLTEGPDSYAHGVDVPPGSRLTDAWMNIPDNPVSGDIYRVFDIVFGPIWRSLSNVDDMLRGQVAAGASPTEASFIRQGTSLGLSERRDVVEDFSRRLVRKLNALIRQFQTTQEAVQLTGPQGAYWVRWNKDAIVGNFTERVEVYSTAPFDFGAEKKQALDMTNFLYGRPEVDNVQLLDELRKRFGFSERILKKTAPTGPLSPDYENILMLHGQPVAVNQSDDHANHRSRHQQFLLAFRTELPVPVQQAIAAHDQQHALMQANIGAPQPTIGTVGQPSQNLFGGAAGGQTGRQQFNQPTPNVAQTLAAALGGGTGGVRQ